MRERLVLARSWPSLVAVCAAAYLLVRLGFDAGGYFPAAFTSAGAIAFAVLGVLLLAHLPRHRFSTPALVGISTLAAFAAWTGLSSSWSAVPDVAVLDLQRAMLYVALFGLGLLAAGSGRFARHLVWAVLAAIVIVAGAGLLSRLFPDLLTATEEVEGLTAFRLSYPLGYWNAFGALAAIGAVLALGLAADVRTSIAARAGAAGVAVLLAVAMYMSLSRGAWLALFIGVAVLLAVGTRRGSLLLTAGIVGGGVVLALSVLQAHPALIDEPDPGGQAAAGRAYAAQLALIVGAVVAAVALVAAGRSSPALMALGKRVLRPVAVGAAALLLIVAVGGYVVKASSVESFAAGRLDDTTDFVDRQWDEFMSPAVPTDAGRRRLTTARSTRSDLYGEVLDGFGAQPLRGEGAGSFEVRWAREREIDEKVLDAHSLELETLGELGIVGAALLLGFLGCVIVAVVGSRRRTGGLGRSQTAAVAAACSVWLAHSFVDWDWEIPGLTGPVIVLAAALFPVGRSRRRRSELDRARAVAGEPTAGELWRTAATTGRRAP